MVPLVVPSSAGGGIANAVHAVYPSSERAYWMLVKSEPPLLSRSNKIPTDEVLSTINCDVILG
jgi:hypothetical protein